MAAAASVAVSTAALACSANAPAMLDLGLLAGNAANAGPIIVERAAAAGKLHEALALNAAVGALHSEIWSTYWVVLYSRRLHEVLEQVDAEREFPPHSFFRGNMRSYYSRWDSVQLSSSTARALRAAAGVLTALDRAEAAGMVVLAEEAGPLRHLARRVSTELAGCAPP